MQVRCQPARPRVLTLSGIGLAAIRRQGNAPKNASNLYQTDSFYRNFWEKTLGSRFGLDYGAASIAIVPAFEKLPVIIVEPRDTPVAQAQLCVALAEAVIVPLLVMPPRNVLA